MAPDKLVAVGAAKLRFKSFDKVSYHRVIAFNGARCVIATTEHIDCKYGPARGTAQTAGASYPAT